MATRFGTISERQTIHPTQQQRNWENVNYLLLAHLQLRQRFWMIDKITPQPLAPPPQQLLQILHPPQPGGAVRIY